MAEIDPALREILSDDARLGQVLELARMLQGNAAPQGPVEPPPEPIPPPPARPAGGLPMMLDALPMLLGALSGSVETLPPEKVNLLEAIRPYAYGLEDSFDRALRMAGLARAVQSVLEGLSASGAEQV